MDDQITINGQDYVLKSSIGEKQIEGGLTYCIVRTYSAGVWAGWYDLTKIAKIGEIKEARRLWRWWSDFTLSALANLGAKKGKEGDNKYAMPVSEVYLTEIIEVIPCNEKSKSFITSQPNYVE